MTPNICERCGQKLVKKQIEKTNLVLKGPIGPGSPDLSNVRSQTSLVTIYVCSNPSCPTRKIDNSI
jgi:hypothetical protein